MRLNWTTRSLLIGTALTLSACGAFRPGADAESLYKRTEVANPLKIPPGMREVAASANSADQSLTISDDTLLPVIRGVALQRDGDVYWLELNARPEAIWMPLQSFLRDNGLAVANADEISGLIETDWRTVPGSEPKRLPVLSQATDFLGSLIGSQRQDSEGLENEKFIFRIERDGDGTKIFASHRRALIAGRGVTRSVASLPGEPQLEAAILHRFLIYLGFSRNESQQMLREVLASARPRNLASYSESGSAPEVQVSRPLPVAWSHVEQAARGMGLKIWGQDRSRGLLGIQIPRNIPNALRVPELDEISPSSTGEAPQLLLQLATSGGYTSVRLQGQDKALSPQAQRALLQRLQDALG